MFYRDNRTVFRTQQIHLDGLIEVVNNNVLQSSRQVLRIDQVGKVFCDDKLSFGIQESTLSL